MNACKSGDKPCPQACQVAEGSMLEWLLDMLDRVPLRHFWLAYVSAILAALAGLHLICF